MSNRLYAGSYLYNLLHDGPLINRVCTKFTPSVDLPSLSAHNLPLCKERGRTCSDLVTPGSAVAEALSECKLTETITIQDATQGRCKSSRCTIQGTLHPQHCPHQILYQRTRLQKGKTANESKESKEAEGSVRSGAGGVKDCTCGAVCMVSIAVCIAIAFFQPRGVTWDLPLVHWTHCKLFALVWDRSLVNLRVPFARCLCHPH